MLRATFAGFSVARGAMSASMKALDVTGQNISNVYTEGYTRQFRTGIRQLRLDELCCTDRTWRAGHGRISDPRPIPGHPVQRSDG